jgi:hypothetical protein
MERSELLVACARKAEVVARLLGQHLVGAAGVAKTMLGVVDHIPAIGRIGEVVAERLETRRGRSR